MLYLIQSLNYYKIGFTTNIKERMKSYKTTNPHAVLLGVAEGTEEDELQYHLKLKEYNHYTEWFELPENIVKDLLSIFTMQDQPYAEKPKKKQRTEIQDMSIYNIKSVITRNILVWLQRFVNEEGEVHVSTYDRKEACKQFGINQQQMSKAIRQLKNFGFIDGDKGVFKINDKILNHKHLLI